MPFEIDTEALNKLKVADISKPPVRQIPHMDFPRHVYLWPKDKTMHPIHDRIPLRDDKERIVRGDDGNPIMVTDFLNTSKKRVKIVNNEQEYKAAIEKGWRDTPHVQEVDDLPEGFEPDIPEAKRGPGRPRNPEVA